MPAAMCCKLVSAALLFPERRSGLSEAEAVLLTISHLHFPLFPHEHRSGLSEAEVQAAIEERAAARAAKDYAASDAVRTRLEAVGILIMDMPQVLHLVLLLATYVALAQLLKL